MLPNYDRLTYVEEQIFNLRVTPVAFNIRLELFRSHVTLLRPLSAFCNRLTEAHRVTALEFFQPSDRVVTFSINDAVKAAENYQSRMNEVESLGIALQSDEDIHRWINDDMMRTFVFLPRSKVVHLLRCVVQDFTDYVQQFEQIVSQQENVMQSSSHQHINTSPLHLSSELEHPPHFEHIQQQTTHPIVIEESQPHPSLSTSVENLQEMVEPHQEHCVLEVSPSE